VGWGNSAIVLRFLGAKKHLYKRLCRSVRPLVRWSVRPHDAITWKTSYVAIASRRGGGRRGKLVMSLFLRAYGLGDPLVSYYLTLFCFIIFLGALAFFEEDFVRLFYKNTIGVGFSHSFFASRLGGNSARSKYF
jgi:hypothetical protein